MNSRTCSLVALALLGLGLGACAAAPVAPTAEGEVGDWLQGLDEDSRDAAVALFSDSLAEIQAVGASPAEQRAALVGLREALAEAVGAEHAATLPFLSDERLGALSFAGAGLDLTRLDADSPRYDDEPDAEDLPDAPPYVTHGTVLTDIDILWCIGNETADLSTAAQKGSIKQAAEEWAARTPVTFTYASSCTGWDVRFGFRTGDHGDGASNAFDGAGSTLAHAFYPLTSRQGQVHFDDAETWTNAEDTTSGQPFDLQTVALHELGHTLGLEHSAESSAVMWPTYGSSLRSLSTDDIDGIQALYAPDDCDTAHDRMELGWAYTGLAKIMSALAGSDPYANAADSSWPVALTDAETARLDAREAAIEGPGSAYALDAWGSGFASLVSLTTAMNDSDDSYTLYGDSWSGLAYAYGELAHENMYDGTLSAGACY